jgi:hypothetical protein
MIWQRAPLYVEAHDLAVWLTQRFDESRATELDRDVAATGREIVYQVARALAFPGVREVALVAADESVLRLRILLRLACEGAHLSPRQHRFAASRLERIGRMLGGWRRERRIQAAARGNDPSSRRRARMAPGASSAAAPTGTTPAIAVRPTATGTTPTSTTTTTASASSSPRRSPNPHLPSSAAMRPNPTASRPVSGGAGSTRARPRLPVASDSRPGPGEAPSSPPLP